MENNEATSDSIELLRKWFSPPFWYDAESGGYIFDNHGHMIVEVRGWGRYAEDVEENEAWEIQNKIGEMIAKMLNRIVSVQVSDTTDDHSSNAADPQNTPDPINPSTDTAE